MSPADDRGLEEKLDLLISLQRIAHAPALDAQREAVVADPVSKAVLSESADWIKAGPLQKAVAKKTGTSVPTVKRRIAELVERGLLKRSGSGGHVHYRTTGLIEV
ncbi:MAG TPA: winged helix-turn-helix domain-containing protein [Solirubrobacterales bacterium]|nr:winged helix-turn-helix domain-containing protein [Solirubrobacterales bacterium]